MRALISLVVVSMLLTGCAASGIEGTWVLVSRDLPDGSMQSPPAIQGCLTFADGHRNFNVYWKDEQGRPVSLAAIAEYALSDSTYEETNIYYHVSGVAGVPEYDLARHSGVATVTREDGRIEFKFPLHDEPFAVFDGDTFTASRDGAFVDHWRRLR